MGMMTRRRFNINLFRGGSESEKWIVMVMVVLGIMMMITDQCWAQPQQQQQHQQQQQDSSITSCVNQLIPCFNYLNLRGSHDNPPDSCCNPLKSVIKSNPECLCSMISIKATNAAQQYGINLTDAQQSPGRCGQHVNPIACLTTATGHPIRRTRFQILQVHHHWSRLKASRPCPWQLYPLFFLSYFFGGVCDNY